MTATMDTVNDVTIFGSADQRTIDQIQRCQSAEEGALAVLCADNHVGYSQPIGGAVAYRDHISPSGVGTTLVAATRRSKRTCWLRT